MGHLPLARNLAAEVVRNSQVEVRGARRRVATWCLVPRPETALGVRAHLDVDLVQPHSFTEVAQQVFHGDDGVLVGVPECFLEDVVQPE